LPIEHCFNVVGLPFAHAARKMSPEKQRELDRQFLLTYPEADLSL